MKKDDREAKALCTADEFRLYAASLEGRLERLSAEDLPLRLRRARTLRDKYRDLYRRQRAGARGKRARALPRELHDSSRTLRKAELFAKMVERLEDRRRVLEDEARRREDLARAAAPRPRLKTGASAPKRPPSPFASGGMPRAPLGAPPPRPARAIQGIFARSASGHFRSANRRFQARRDTRG